MRERLRRTPSSPAHDSGRRSLRLLGLRGTLGGLVAHDHLLVDGSGLREPTQTIADPTTCDAPRVTGWPGRDHEWQARPAARRRSALSDERRDLAREAFGAVDDRGRIGRPESRARCARRPAPRRHGPRPRSPRACRASRTTLRRGRRSGPGRAPRVAASGRPAAVGRRRDHRQRARRRRPATVLLDW